MSLAGPAFEGETAKLKGKAQLSRPMRGLGLLEGERVHRVVRRHPLGCLPRYAPALGLLGLAALLALVAAVGAQAARDLDATTGPLAVPLLLVAWWALMGVVLGAAAVRVRAMWPLVYGLAVAVLGGVSVTLTQRPDLSAPATLALLPWLTLAAVPIPVAIAEAQRRAEVWVFTSFRLVRLQGLVHPREEGWRLTRLERCDAERRGPRSLDLGDLVVRRKEGDVRIPGVRPLHGLRDELELLLHTSPEAPYLGEQRTTAEQVHRLLRPDGNPK